MSPAAFLLVGSGPDVFADALVPAGAARPAFLLSRYRFPIKRLVARLRFHCADGYRFAKAAR